MNATYVGIVVASLSPSPTTENEMVSLNGSATGGLAVQFIPATVKLVNGFQTPAAMTIVASKSVVPGNYTLEIRVQGGSFSHTEKLPVRVVPNLVYLQAFTFSPKNLTVKLGTTVYWYNADPPHVWCGVSDTGDKDVTFTSGTASASPVIASYTLWSFTFTKAGSYTYFDTHHTSSGNATIIVTSG